MAFVGKYTTPSILSFQNGQHDLQAYQVVQALGEGAFGEVMLIVDKSNPSCAVAMKKLSLENDPSKTKCTQIKKEALIQRMVSKVGHDNVIRLIGIRHDISQYYLFLEYADGGELFDKIEPDVGMVASRAQFYFRQLICGLKYLHEQGVVHRDIKPENLLLTSTDLLKISDFGMATIFRHEGKERILNMSCGTLPYAAPEIIAGKEYKAEPVDIWSCGIVLITMLTGELPWDKANDASAAYLDWLTNTSLDELPWCKIDVRGLSFLRKLVTDKVAARATIPFIEAHPWFTHNYASEQFENSKKRCTKRRNLEGIENLPDTQIPSYHVPKRRHMDLDGLESSYSCSQLTIEKDKSSFSQPTNINDMLLTQQYDMSQGNNNLLQRMVRRMTRFCVKVDMDDAIARVLKECECAGFSVRQRANNQILVTYRLVSMMVSAYSMLNDKNEEKIMIDFRRSRGDGLQFKRMFLELRNRMNDLVCEAGNHWLKHCGLTPAYDTEYNYVMSQPSQKSGL